MKILKKIYLIIVLLIFTSCNVNQITTIDKGILIYKSKYFGRFDTESYTFEVLYKGDVHRQNVDGYIYNQYNIKDTVELVVKTKKDKNRIYTFLPKN